MGFAWVQCGARRDREVHLGSRGFTRVRLWVHSGWCGFTQAHLGIILFIRFCVGSLVRTKWSLGSIVFLRILSGAPRGGGVHSGLRRSTLVRLEVVGFISVCVGSLGLA